MSEYAIDISEEAGVRYLHFGSEWVQGAMRVRRPIDLELAYTREMMAGLLMRERTPRRILLVGLGAASLTKFCYWRLPDAKITVVEISPGVVAAARQFFKLPEEDARLRIVIGDGAEYIQRSRPSFDYILIDGYDENARVGALDSLPFYQACRARLADDGLLATNLFGRARKYKPALDRLAQAFDGRSMAFPSCDSGNVIAFAATGDEVNVSLPDLRERASTLKRDINLDLRATVSRLEQAKSLPGDALVL